MLMSFNFRCKEPPKTMPTKASLPSALVETTDLQPHSMDSSGKHSKLSSSRSKLSSHSSQAETGNSIFKGFKSFRRKKPTSEADGGTTPGLTRRPSLIVTEAAEDAATTSAGGEASQPTKNSITNHPNRPHNLQIPAASSQAQQQNLPNLIPPPSPSVLKNPSSPGFMKAPLTPMLKRKLSSELLHSPDQMDMVTTPSSNNNSQKAL